MGAPELQNIEKKKCYPLTHPLADRALSVCASPRRSAGSVGDGEWKGSSSMFRLCPADCVRRYCGLPGVSGPSARRIHGPPNLRAQCKQPRKFCQAKTDKKSTKSCCLVLILSIPSGDVPDGHNGKITANLEIYTAPSRKTIPHYE